MLITIKDLRKIPRSTLLPKVYTSSGYKCYLDLFREKLIIKTPEETVRHKILQYLVIDGKCLKNLSE